jgi:hypothetical protein
MLTGHSLSDDEIKVSIICKIFKRYIAREGNQLAIQKLVDIFPLMYICRPQRNKRKVCEPTFKLSAGTAT